jgi:hypothetical protein
MLHAQMRSFNNAYFFFGPRVFAKIFLLLLDCFDKDIKVMFGLGGMFF